MAEYNPYIKSPLNYIGGKYKILPQILPLFPHCVNCFVDLFAGGANVGLNVSASQVILNDNLTYLIELYDEFRKTSLEAILNHINNRIEAYSLSTTNESGYKQIRALYNKLKNPLDLFVLVAYSFNHQIRFNSNHEFNNPFGKKRSCFNDTMKQNLVIFIRQLQEKNVILSANNFDKFDISVLQENDFVYCDPPYLISTGAYNDGKRGFTGWTAKEKMTLLLILTQLNNRGIRFALSNVISHKGKTNKVLERWINENEKFTVNFIRTDYTNANYQVKVRDRSETQEILITNYKPQPARSLFGESEVL